MNKFFEKDSLIIELCDNRRDMHSHKMIKNSKEYTILRDKMENKLKSFLNYVLAEHYEYVKNEMENFLSEYVLEFAEYWDNLFYKFGFIDGMNLNKEIKEDLEKVEMEKLLDSFMNENQLTFMQYFEKNREKKLMNREDYKALENEKEKIMKEYPKARKFLQDEEITDMTDDEKDAVLQIIDLQEQIKVIELKEAYKLGAKEVYIFLEEQDMLNI